jgi:hypothetical protein
MDLTAQVCAEDQSVKQILHLKMKSPRKRGAVLNSSVGTSRLLQRTKERDEAYIIGSNQGGAVSSAFVSTLFRLRCGFSRLSLALSPPALAFLSWAFSLIAQMTSRSWPLWIEDNSRGKIYI